MRPKILVTTSGRFLSAYRLSTIQSKLPQHVIKEIDDFHKKQQLAEESAEAQHGRFHFGNLRKTFSPFSF